MVYIRFAAEILDCKTLAIDNESIEIPRFFLKNLGLYMDSKVFG
jgi:hypothetical protein